jgi:hypothetical protein
VSREDRLLCEISRAGGFNCTITPFHSRYRKQPRVSPTACLSLETQIATKGRTFRTMDSIGNNEADRIRMFSELKFNYFGISRDGCSAVVDAVPIGDLAADLRRIHEEIPSRW